MKRALRFSNTPDIAFGRMEVSQTEKVAQNITKGKYFFKKLFIEK